MWMLKLAGTTLLVLGRIAAPVGAFLALLSLQDDDPPYDSPQPWGWIAVAGCVAIYVGWRILRAARLRPTERLPDYWADGQ
jgi:hypothetical protein